MASLLTDVVQAQNLLPYPFVDINDIKAYAPQSLQGDLRPLVKAIEDRWSTPPTRWQWQEKSVSNTEISGTIVAYFYQPAGKSFYQKFDFVWRQQSLSEWQPQQIIPISKTKFSVTSYVRDLVTVLQDAGNELKIYMPFGGPGFDANVTPRSQGRLAFLIPHFQGSLPKSLAIEKRCEPSYYKCKPFVRMAPVGQTYSLYGFHAEPWKEQFERGWVSAGCFRLGDRDLLEMFDIVRYGSQKEVPFAMSVEKMRDKDVHPYPLITDSYETAWRWRLKDGRIVFNTKRVLGVPPSEIAEPFPLEQVQHIDLKTRQKLGVMTSEPFTSP